MMEVSGPRGLGEQGLLGAPPAAHKKKPNYMFSTHTPHNTHHTHTTQHTHSCNCTQSSRSTPKAGTNNTGTEIVLSNMDTSNGITAVKELRNTHTTRRSQTNESDISCLNDIQYMDYKPKGRIDYTKGVEDFSLQSLSEGKYYKTFTQSKDRGNKLDTEKQSGRHIE
jgi:hypothetical protein